METRYDREASALWMFYRRSAPAHYTTQTLHDIGEVRDRLRRHFASPDLADFPVHYFVMASHQPGVFKLGGDLRMFAEAIASVDGPARLRGYAHACIDLVHGLLTAFDLPIVTVAAIAGQALGGGLEAALALDYVFAERDAKGGVPEVAFNSFPGMGAVSLLTRRLGGAGAEQVISSGQVFSGEELYDLGVVDALAEPGGVEAAVQAWMAEGGEAQHQRRLKIAGLRRELFPVSREELIRITDLWVDCSCNVSEADLRHMQRLAAAQHRRFGGRETSA